MSFDREDSPDETLDHHGVAYETDLAVGFYDKPRRLGIKREVAFWVPKSVIVNVDASAVTVQGWWYAKEFG